MYVEKAAEMTFMQKLCTQNVDEIDTWGTLVRFMTSGLANIGLTDQLRIEACELDSG
jgi:hypothetical protein